MGDVLQSVRGGKSLAEALAKHKFFPSIYVNMVRAGEIGGFLDAVLLRLLEYLERSQELRDEARAALAYPVVLTCAMGASILVLLTYVLPKFSALFTDIGKTLPLSARIVLGVSDAVRGYWWLGLAIVAIVGVRDPLVRAHPRGELRRGTSGSSVCSCSATCCGRWRSPRSRARSGRSSRAACRWCRRSAS